MADVLGPLRWTVGQDAALLKLWRSGKTFTDIGERLGVGRSAAIGRLHRLAAKSPDLKREMGVRRVVAAPKPTIKATTERGNRESAKNAVVKIKKAQAKAAQGFVRLAAGPALDALGTASKAEEREALRAGVWSPFDGRAPIALEHLGDGCKWPIGDLLTPGFGFCGAPRGEGKSPYCAHHHAIAYRGLPPREPAPVEVNRVPSRGDRLFMGSLG